MANHKSAKTRIKRNAKRAVVNGAVKNRARTFVKKVESEILAGNKDNAKKMMVQAESELMKAERKGVFTANSASRKVSRLSKKIKAL